MSVAEEISRLQTAKSDIKTSIENKGVTVPPNATLDLYPGYIDQISTGVQPDSITLNLSGSAFVGISTTATIDVTFGSTTFTLTDVSQATVTSSDESVATVSVSGSTITVTPLATGSATITASIGSATDSVSLLVIESSWGGLYQKIKAGIEPVGGTYTDDTSGTTWRVVHVMADSSAYGGTGAGAILQMVNCLTGITKQFGASADTANTNWSNTSGVQSNDYLRYYLNNGFYATLGNDFTAVIATASLPTCANGSSTPTYTSDKIFVASKYEMMGTTSSAAIDGVQWDYWKSLIPSPTDSSNSNRAIRDGNGKAQYVWLRSCFQGLSYVWRVGPTGNLSITTPTDSPYVLPACLIA